MRGLARSSCVVAAVLALPAVASAATVTTDRECYRAGEQGTLTVGGFRAGATIDAVVDGQPMVNLLPDGAGAASAPFTPLASPAAGDVPETLSATDAATAPPLSAQVTYRVTATDVRMTPARARLSTVVTWRLRGFGAGAAYLHVARRNAAGRTVTIRAIKLGTLAGPCGSLSARTKQLPIPRPRAGTTYVLRFNASRSPNARALVEHTVTTPAPRSVRRGPQVPPATPCTQCGVS
jgi:hypothetical protein